MAFSLTEQSADWVGSAPVRYSQTGTVSAAPDAVFATLADHAGWPTWFKGMSRAVADGDGVGVGATRTVWVGPLRATERFVSWDPGSRYAFSVVEANGPGLRSLVEVFDLEAAGTDATRVTYTIGAEGAVALLNPGLKAVARQIVSGGLKGLVAKHQ